MSRRTELTNARVRKALVQGLKSAVFDHRAKQFTMTFATREDARVAWEFLTGGGQNDICAVLDRWLRDGK